MPGIVNQADIDSADDLQALQYLWIDPPQLFDVVAVVGQHADGGITILIDRT